VTKKKSTNKKKEKRSFRFISVNHHFHVTLERRIEKIEEGEEKKRENLAEIIDANSY
jgi:hypothetical protein